MIRENSWTEKEYKVLREEYPTIRDPRELAEKLGRSYVSMKTRAQRLGLKREVFANNPWSAGLEEMLTLLYPDHTVAQLAVYFGVTESAIIGRAYRLKLRKDPAFALACSSKGFFKKGSTPANKGKKWSEFMSKEGMRNSRSTTFKKGNLPPNTKADFVISVRKDKNRVQYLFIRVAKAKWVPLLRYNYEKLNGKITKGLNLVHADGDRMNCDASNGLLLSNAELMQRNTYHKYPKEIANAIQLRGALNRQINKHLKKVRNEK
jgi:hypothetical protein